MEFNRKISFIVGFHGCGASLRSFKRLEVKYQDPTTTKAKHFLLSAAILPDNSNQSQRIHSPLSVYILNEILKIRVNETRFYAGTLRII